MIMAFQIVFFIFLLNRYQHKLYGKVSFKKGGSYFLLLNEIIFNFFTVTTNKQYLKNTSPKCFYFENYLL